MTMRHFLLLLASVGLLTAVARGEDEITYFDRKSKRETKVSGTIQSEDIAKIDVKVGSSGVRTVPAIDVIDVVYDLSPILRTEYRGAMARELAADKAAKDDVRKAEWADALKRYRQLLTQAVEPKAQRHLEFKIARVLAQQVDDSGSTSAAIAGLAEFQKTHPRAWQRHRAADLVANLQLIRDNIAAAQRTYEELAAHPDLPPEARHEYVLKIARVLLQAQKPDQAEAKLQDLRRQEADTPVRIRADLLLAECRARAGEPDNAVPHIEEILKRVEDPELKGLAYSTLGDCYRLANRPRDAMWSYLWVEVIYHADRREHAKALYHLVKLFQEFKDENKAQQFRDKLAGPQFAGLEYQRKLLNEK
jgi:predicted negative regulator of RcsB-dependent stress response